MINKFAPLQCGQNPGTFFHFIHFFTFSIFYIFFFVILCTFTTHKIHTKDTQKSRAVRKLETHPLSKLWLFLFLTSDAPGSRKFKSKDCDYIHEINTRSVGKKSITNRFSKWWQKVSLTWIVASASENRREISHSRKPNQIISWNKIIFHIFFV